MRPIHLVLAAVLPLACTPHGEGAPRYDPAPDDPPTSPARPSEPAEPSVMVEPIGRPEPRPARMRCHAEPIDYPAGVRPLIAAVGDLDGDGRDDVVVHSIGAHKLGVVRGLTEGAFALHGVVEVPSRSLSPVIGDFDGDGKADVVTANPRDGSVTFLRGDGKGNLTPGRETVIGRQTFQGTALHLDRDGHLDLAVSQFKHIQLLLGDGKGGFRKGARLRAGQAPEGIEVLDVDGDGRDDLIYPNNDTHELSVFRRKRGAGFRARQHVACGAGGLDIAVADFDRDGFLDAAMGNMHSQDICLFEGAGKGRFGVRGTLTAIDPDGLAASDADRDGIPDLVISTGSRVEVWRGDGQGGFAEYAYVHAGNSVRDMFVRDLDRDGHDDVILVNGRSETITVVMGQACRVLPDP